MKVFRGIRCSGFDFSYAYLLAATCFVSGGEIFFSPSRPSASVVYAALGRLCCFLGGVEKTRADARGKLTRRWGGWYG